MQAGAQIELPTGRRARRPGVAGSLWGPLWLAMALLAAVLAQRSLTPRHALLDGLLLYAAAVFALFRAMASLPTAGRDAIADNSVDQTGSPAETPAEGARIRWPLAGLALVLAALAYRWSGQNLFHPRLVAVWLLAVACFAAAFWQRDLEWEEQLRQRCAGLWRGSFDLRLAPGATALLFVLGLAAFFRYYQLAGIPAEMTSDHAEKLLDVSDVLEGQTRIFFPRNTGREPLQFYLTAALAGLVGPSYLALKLGTATFSLLSVLGTYLFARELFGSRVGLAASALEAAGKWAVTIGRVGLRFPLSPAFVGFSLLFLYRGLMRGNRNDFLLSGFAMGMGLLGYSTFRVVPVLVGTLLLLRAAALLRARQRVAPLLAKAVLCFGAMLVVMTPLLRYMVDHPAMFWFRTVTRIAALERPLPGDPLSILAGNIGNALLMFNWRGDVVWVNNIPLDPALDYVTGALFVLGLALVLNRLWRLGDLRSAILLMSLFALLLPSILSLAFPGENPSNVRASGAIPVVYTIAALPLALLLGHGSGRAMGSWARPAAGVLVAGLLALTIQANYRTYFRLYPEQHQRAAQGSRAIGRAIEGFLRLHGSPREVYMVSWPHWVDHRLLGIEMGDVRWANVLQPRTLAASMQQLDADPRRRLLLVHAADTDSQSFVQRTYPHAVRSEFRRPGTDSPWYVAYEVIAEPR